MIEEDEERKEDEAWSLFQSIDANQNGRLSVFEVHTAMDSLGYSHTEINNLVVKAFISDDPTDEISFEEFFRGVFPVLKQRQASLWS